MHSDTGRADQASPHANKKPGTMAGAFSMSD